MLQLYSVKTQHGDVTTEYVALNIYGDSILQWIATFFVSPPLPLLPLWSIIPTSPYPENSEVFNYYSNLFKRADQLILYSEAVFTFELQGTKKREIMC
jgi:hypothetical protein